MQMATDRWTLLEDDMIVEHYQERGPEWEGWKDVLPNRTKSSIRSRAKRLGLRRSRFNAVTMVKYMEPDPYENDVFARLEVGFAPSQIDDVMGWPRGTAAAIAVDKWRRERLLGWRGSEEVDRVQP